MENIKETENNVSQAIEGNDGYEDIEITSQEEMVREIKRLRREVWELKQNHSRSISDRESDELFSKLQKLQKENKENNSKEARFQRYARILAIIDIVISALSAPISLIVLFILSVAEQRFEMLPVTPLAIASVLVLSIITLKLSKKKHYQVMFYLNMAASFITLFVFLFALVGFGKIVTYEQSIITMITVGTVLPFPIITCILSAIAYRASLDNKKGE